MNFLLLCLDRYLLNVIGANRYLPTGSKVKVYFDTSRLLGMELCPANASSNYHYFWILS